MIDPNQLPDVSGMEAIDEVMAKLVEAVPLFATTEVDIAGHTHTVFANQPSTLPGAFMLMMQHAEKEAVVYQDERYTYAQVFSRAASVAHALRDDYGIREGDRVVIAMRNYPDYIFAYLGVIAAGGVAVLVNAWWGEEEISWALGNSEAKLAIADEHRAQSISACQPSMPLLVAKGGNNYNPLEALYERGESSFPEISVSPDDDAYILYTSGSTGLPKGSVTTHRGGVSVLMTWILVALALKVMGKLNPDPNHQPVALVGVPFFHVTGLVSVMCTSLLVGRKLVIMHKWDVVDAFRLIDREGVTSFSGVPTMSYELSTHPARTDYNLSTLADIGGGGAPRPADHVKLMKDNLPTVTPALGYGLTETNAISAAITGEEYMNRPTSTGRATPPLVTLKIMDGDGNEVATNEVGEIWVKSAANFRGYWRNEEATERAIKGGWFLTGDLARMDEEGYIHIVDRKKEIIIRGGENISTLEVEGVIHAIEGVEDVVVFGIADERMGEIVGALLYIPEGAPSVADVLGKAGTSLAKYKLPEKIWVTNEPLPKIGSGKNDRKAIKDTYNDIVKAEQA